MDGPPLEVLLRRLAECPPDFLAEPRQGPAGVVDVAAVVADLLRDLGGGPLTAKQAETFRPAKETKARRNRLRAVLVAAWLLHDPWFRERRTFAESALAFLAHGLDDLAGLVAAPLLTTDPDRREELVRLTLKALGLRPAGETEAQAQDRLATLDSAERQRVIREAQEAEKRAQAVREAMAKKAAEEAAARYMRE